MIDLHVEVAQALIVVAQPAIAFVQQVLVDRAFLVNRNGVLEALGADLAPSTSTFTRALVGGEVEVSFLRRQAYSSDRA